MSRIGASCHANDCYIACPPRNVSNRSEREFRFERPDCGEHYVSGTVASPQRELSEGVIDE